MDIILTQNNGVDIVAFQKLAAKWLKGSILRLGKHLNIPQT